METALKRPKPYNSTATTEEIDENSYMETALKHLKPYNSRRVADGIQAKRFALFLLLGISAKCTNNVIPCRRNPYPEGITYGR